MIKHLLSSLLAIFLVIGASEQAFAQDKMYLGYCDGLISDGSTGKVSGLTGNNVKVTEAIRISGNMLAPYAGLQLSGVHAGLANSSTLPNSLSAAVSATKGGAELASGTFSAPSVGWSDIMFDQPYTITGQEQELWISFSFIQSKKLNIISFAGETHADGCWVAKSGKYTDYSGQNWGSLAVEAIITGDNLPQHDLMIKSFSSERSTTKVGLPIVVSGEVRNKALATAEGFEIAYSVNDGQVTGSVPFSQTLSYRDVAPFTFEIPSDALTEGNADITVEVKWLGGIEDEYVADNTASTSVGLYTNAYPRNVLLEEFTTEKCGNCPGAVTRINSALDNYDLRSSVVWVCHHTGYYTDFLTISASSTYCEFFGTSGTYAPAIMVDRTYNPNYSDNDMPGGVIGFPGEPSFIASWLNNDLNEPAFVMVDIVSATCIDGDIKIKVRAEKVDAFEAVTAEPRINIWIKESEIDAQSQSGLSGSPIGYHENAIRKVLTNVWGDKFEWNDSVYEAEFTCTADPNWVPENLEAVAFISRYNSNVREREVYNAAQSSFTLTDMGISYVVNNETVSSLEYTLDGKLATGREHGFVVRRSIAADGSVRTEKVMK